MRTASASLAITLAFTILGCSGSSRQQSPDDAKSAKAGSGMKESMEGEDVMAVPPENLRVVMQAKTAWASSLLEAISTRDYERIQSNSEALRKLSLDAGFIAQDTLAYRTLAEEFRQEVTLLADRANARDQSGIENSYHRVTAACFRCHEYVNSERYFSSMPGRSGM
jgi:cytochrome c556